MNVGICECVYESVCLYVCIFMVMQLSRLTAAICQGQGVFMCVFVRMCVFWCMCVYVVLLSQAVEQDNRRKAII